MPDVSALQLVVPGAQVLLDAVRDVPGVSLLPPPHVSLGYPWLPAAEALARLPAVAEAAAAVPAFDAVLTGPHVFAPDARGRVLVHARLVDDEPVRRLAALLGADLTAVHLSVARVVSEGRVDDVLAAVAPLLPLTTPVRHLELTVQADRLWSRALLAPLA